MNPQEYPDWLKDVPSIAWFSMIWGCSLTPLPKGNMGNLIVYPGTHYVIANILRDVGAGNSVWSNNKKGEKQRPLPSLNCPGVTDGRPYFLISEPGDVVIAHPFMAYGIGLNITDNPRLAVYCRLHSNNHLKYRKSMHNGGDEMAAGTWTGDLFNLLPGLQQNLTLNFELLYFNR